MQIPKSKYKGVSCDNCINFEPAIFKDETDLFSPIKQRARCKLGKRIMFRVPIFQRSTSHIATNDYGYVRDCNDFKQKPYSQNK